MKSERSLSFFSYMKILQVSKFSSSTVSAIAGCLFTGLLCASFIGTTSAQQLSEEPLTNASIVKLVRAGFRDKTVVALMHSRAVRFDLSPDSLIELKKRGVSEHLILAMVAREEGTLVNDSFGDSFFDDGSPPKKGDKSGSRTSDIFGSSGGSNGRSTNRGAKGASDQESETVGSASVHILRPSSEADGGKPKLEKTPTLNNESIVELVEAGFSEGTIIRRIEQSPADFDLSPPKLIVLRKRRVSEPLINAMRLAMGDDPSAKRSPSNPQGK